MPTKKKRKIVIPDNLPALTTEEDICPSLFTGDKLAKKDPESNTATGQGFNQG